MRRAAIVICSLLVLFVVVYSTSSGLWFATGDEQGLSAAGDEQGLSAADDDAAHAGAVESEGQRGDARVAVAKEIEVSKAATALDIRVEHVDGSPAPSVGIVVRRARGSRRVGVIKARTDASGEVRVPVEAGLWKIGLDCAVLARRGLIGVAEGEIRPVRLVLREGLHISGRVQGANGVGIPDADIVTSLPAYLGHDAQVVARSDDNGDFILYTGYMPCVIGARAAGFSASKMQLIRGEAGADVECTIVLSAFGGCVSGLVRGPDGSAIANATVRVGEGIACKIAVGMDGLAPPVPVDVVTDEQGKFLAVGIAPGSRVPVMCVAEGFAPWESEVTVAERNTTACDIRLGHGCQVKGKVLDQNGEPIALVLVDIGKRGALDYARDVTQEDGSFLLTGVATGERVLRASHKEQGRAERTVNLVTSVATEVVLKLAVGATLRGYCIGENGKRLGGIRLLVVGGGKAKMVKVDAAGDFECRDVPAGRLHVSVLGDEYDRSIVPNWNPADGVLVMRVKERKKKTVAIVGRVVDASGRACTGATVAVRSLINGNVASGRVKEDGAIVINKVRPGKLSITVTHKGLPVRLLGPYVAVADQAINLGTISMVQGAEVTFECPGELQTGIVLILSGSGEFWGPFARIKDGSARAFLAPGRYWVRMRAADYASVGRMLTVAPHSRNIRFEMPADKGEACKIALIGCDVGDVAKVFRKGADMVDVFEWDSEMQHYATRLPVGAYRLQVGNRQVEFSVRAGGDNNVKVQM